MHNVLTIWFKFWGLLGGGIEGGGIAVVDVVVAVVAGAVVGAVLVTAAGVGVAEVAVGWGVKLALEVAPTPAEGGPVLDMAG